MNGTTGEALLTFDTRKGRFYDNGNNPLEDRQVVYDSSANNQSMIDARLPYNDEIDETLPY